MSDCQLCYVPAILAKETVVFLLNNIEATKNLYKTYHQVPTSHASQLDFTPGFRIRYKNQETAVEAATHKQVWAEIHKSLDKSPYSIIFDTQRSVDDANLAIYLENAVLPKDWDIFLLTDTQYILTKRAAKILLSSAVQFNTNLSDYIRSFKVLKVIDAVYKS